MSSASPAHSSSSEPSLPGSPNDAAAPSVGVGLGESALPSAASSASESSSATAVTAASSNPVARYWIALALTPGLGHTRCRRLAQMMGGVENIFRASLTELEATHMPVEAAQSIALGRSLELAEEEFAKTSEVGASIVTLDCPEYPTRLAEIYDPPVLLYIRGDAAILSEPSIAVVGTRVPSPYGLGMAERLSLDLAARGLVIVSGMARGVDTAAHRGCMNANGRTVAVFGTAINEIYPKQNAKLAEQIVGGGGALVSEFPIGTFPAPQNFPIRNRIISGMSMGVLVVEAGEYSGTRITARCALEQNRDVYAVPGNVVNKLSWTPNTLIKQGAKLVATWEDVWEELPDEAKAMLPSSNPAASEQAATASLFQNESLPPHEKRIYSLLKADEPTHIDELVEKLAGHVSSAEIFAALFELELASKIRQMPGKNYVKSF
jgi:DNA processing protein